MDRKQFLAKFGIGIAAIPTLTFAGLSRKEKTKPTIGVNAHKSMDFRSQNMCIGYETKYNIV